jgi:hypothetical protein
MSSTSRLPPCEYPDLPTAAKPCSLSKVLGRMSSSSTELWVPEPRAPSPASIPGQAALGEWIPPLPSECQVAGPLEAQLEFLDLGGLPEQVQYSAVQCSAVQCSAVQCSAVQCSVESPAGSVPPVPVRGPNPGHPAPRLRAPPLGHALPPPAGHRLCPPLHLPVPQHGDLC